MIFAAAIFEEHQRILLLQSFPNLIRFDFLVFTLTTQSCICLQHYGRWSEMGGVKAICYFGYSLDSDYYTVFRPDCVGGGRDGRCGGVKYADICLF